MLHTSEGCILLYTSGCYILLEVCQHSRKAASWAVLLTTPSEARLRRAGCEALRTQHLPDYVGEVRPFRSSIGKEV